MPKSPFTPQPTLLDVPVPPEIETALGYDGVARFVAFFWQPWGDELRYNDGKLEADGHWHAWQVYSQHALVWRGLDAFNFGNSDESATHWFVLDRTERKAYALPCCDAQRMVRAQHPEIAQMAAKAVLSPDEWLREVEDIAERIQAVLSDQANRPVPSWEEIRQRLQAQYQRVEELRTWLDDKVSNDAAWNSYVCTVLRPQPANIQGGDA